jgi:hypothetical protein
MKPERRWTLNPRKTFALTVATAFLFSVIPHKPSEALISNGTAIEALMRIHSIEQLFLEVDAALQGVRCSGANADKVAYARTLFRSAKESVKAGKYGEALTKLGKARLTISSIPRTAGKARFLTKVRSKTGLLIAIIAVVVLGSVMAKRAQAGEVVQPREMSQRARDSLPGYFDLIESSGCG